MRLAPRVRDEIQGRPGWRIAVLAKSPPTRRPMTLAEMAHKPADIIRQPAFTCLGASSGRALAPQLHWLPTHAIATDPRRHRRARDSRVVVVTVHSHEPANLSPVPADFVRDFAARSNAAQPGRRNGPPSARGIGSIGGRVIFLASAAPFDASIPPGSADVCDGHEPQRVALDRLINQGH